MRAPMSPILPVRGTARGFALAVVLLPLWCGSAPGAVAPPQCSGFPPLHLEVGDPPTLVGVCSDPEGEKLAITITQPPGKGIAQGVSQGATGAYVLYGATAVGADSLSFRANDGTSDSNEVTVTTDNVPAVNDP